MYVRRQHFHKFPAISCLLQSQLHRNGKLPLKLFLKHQTQYPLFSSDTDHLLWLFLWGK